MTSAEAAQLLSRLRFGIDRKLFPGLTHTGLNKLIIDIQPGHLQLMNGGPAQDEARDSLRANLLRQRLGGNASNN
jgi:protein arginine kinase